MATPVCSLCGAGVPLDRSVDLEVAAHDGTAKTYRFHDTCARSLAAMCGQPAYPDLDAAD